jgi:CRP/FNR family transcriptional regulator, nitrogen oxide reductase regulator
MRLQRVALFDRVVAASYRRFRKTAGRRFMQDPPLHRSLIQTFPVFSGMGQSALDDVLARATAQRIPKAGAAFRQGERARAFFVLLHGRLKVVKVTPQGQQVVIRFVHPGDIFGIAKALRREDYPATATAVVDSVALTWPNEVWDSFVARYPSFATNVMQMMGQRIQEAHTKVKELSTEEAEHRVAHTILRLLEQSGRVVDDGILIDFPVTQQEIAESSGTTLHTVSRILSVWANDGLVEIGRQRVVVTDPGRLRLLADGMSD